MANPVPRRAGVADRSSVLAVLDGAFREDPVLRWRCPEPEHYPAFAAAFFGGLFDLRVDGGEVWVIEGAAAALWNPPGGNRLPESTQEEIWSAATDHVLSTAARVRLDRHDELVRRLLPAERGFYLGVVGVEPSRQGQGWAAACWLRSSRGRTRTSSRPRSRPRPRATYPSIPAWASRSAARGSTRMGRTCGACCATPAEIVHQARHPPRDRAQLGERGAAAGGAQAVNGRAGRSARTPICDDEPP